MSHVLLSLLALIGINTPLTAEQKHDIAVATAQTAPGVTAAAGSRALQLPLSDILVVCSIMFVLLQVAYLLWKWHRDARREDERQYDRQRGVTRGAIGRDDDEGF